MSCPDFSQNWQVMNQSKNEPSRNLIEKRAVFRLGAKAIQKSDGHIA